MSCQLESEEARQMDGGLEPLTLDGGLRAVMRRVVAGVGWRSSPRQWMERRSGIGRRRDEFLAVACHELRSPLASMRHAVRLLGKADLDASTMGKAHAVLERQLVRMTRLVDDLGDVSRVANGRMRLRTGRVDLCDVVKDAIETLAPEIQARDHELTVAWPERPLWIAADAPRLEQVFVNLLGNAAKFTAPGGQLAVWVHAGDRQATVRIRDSGVGIDPQALPRIFDLFRQVSGVDQQSQSGMGIGLAVVRSLVELHGGSVTAASAGCGRGSEFTVRLPCEA